MSETSLLLGRFMHYRGDIKRSGRSVYILAGKTSEVAGGSDSEDEEEEGIRYKEREEGIPWGVRDGDVGDMGNKAGKSGYMHPWSSSTDHLVNKNPQRYHHNDHGRYRTTRRLRWRYIRIRHAPCTHLLYHPPSPTLKSHKNPI